jgi:hypothetical protein
MAITKYIPSQHLVLYQSTLLALLTTSSTILLLLAAVAVDHQVVAVVQVAIELVGIANHQAVVVQVKLA